MQLCITYTYTYPHTLVGRTAQGIIYINTSIEGGLCRHPYMHAYITTAVAKQSRRAKETAKSAWNLFLFAQSLVEFILHGTYIIYIYSYIYIFCSVIVAVVVAL